MTRLVNEIRFPTSGELEALARGRRRSTAAFSSRRPTLDSADHGRLHVEAGSTVRLEAIDRDLLLFPRGPALVATPGWATCFVDPVSAFWCAAGDRPVCRARLTTDVRFDWFAVDALAQALPEAVGFLLRALARRVTLVMPLPAPLYLAQRAVARGVVPELPPSAWRAVGPVAPAARTSEGARDPGEPDPNGVLARRGREYLCRTFRETLPVGHIADRLDCSEGHLSRTFKRWTGMTLLGYRHELRMRAALDLVETDGDDLATLACDLGYASHSHFTTRFERTFRLTPSAYRRMTRDFRTVRENG